MAHEDVVEEPLELEPLGPLAVDRAVQRGDLLDVACDQGSDASQGVARSVESAGAAYSDANRRGPSSCPLRRSSFEHTKVAIEALTIGSALAQKYIAGQAIKKVVVVPGRLVNVVL